LTDDDPKNIEELKDRFRNGAPTWDSKFGNADGIQQQFDEMLAQFPDEPRFIIFSLEALEVPSEPDSQFRRMPFRINMWSVRRDGTIV
jgi:hypothetical protein